MFYDTYFDDEEGTDDEGVAEHWKHVIDYSEHRIIKILLNDLNNTKPLLIETFLPEQVQHQRGKQYRSREQVNHQTMGRGDVYLLTYCEGLVRFGEDFH